MRRPRFSNDVCIEEGINLMVIRNKKDIQSPLGLYVFYLQFLKPVCYDVVRIHGFCGDIVFACCWDRLPVRANDLCISTYFCQGK